MTKVMLTEEQRKGIEILRDAIDNPDSIPDDEFTAKLFELKEAGVNVEQVLLEEHGIEL